MRARVYLRDGDGEKATAEMCFTNINDVVKMRI